MSDQAPKRRLPVLQTRDEPPAPPDEERPPWHWSPIGAVATFLVWLPLAALAESLTRTAASPADPSAAVPAASLWMLPAQTLAFFVGAFAGGFVVGRLGGKAGRKEATLAGVLAGVLAWLITLTQGPPSGAFMALVYALMLVILATIGGGAALLGGRVGLRLRPRNAPPAPP